MQTPRVNDTDPISLEQLAAFLTEPAQPWASIFLPIAQGTMPRQQNAIRLENLLCRAEAQLIARGMAPSEAERFRAPATALIRDFAFWEHQSEGLALFINAAGYHAFRLPYAFAEQAVVDQRMALTPLIPLLNGSGPFYLLALTLGGVRLYAGSAYGFQPIDLPDAPASLEAFLARDEFSKEHQFHTGVPGRGGERGAIFHGQDARDGTVQKQETLRYFQQIDRSVTAALANAHAPLLLAGLSYLVALYRGVNSYAHLFDAAISVNPDDLSLTDLHARARAAVMPALTREGDTALQRYYTLQGSQPALASDHLRTVLPAAFNGRIDILLLTTGAQCWGVYELASDALTLHKTAEPHDSDLLNLAAIETILHGGSVYALAPERAPGAAPCAAIFRY